MPHSVISAVADWSQATQGAKDLKDVFISYSSLDRSWVVKELLDPLEKAGLKVVIDYRDFPLGRLITKNIEWAVQTCRHTLAVISGNSLGSDWVGRELGLVINADPAARQEKLIPLVKDGSQLPTSISLITAVDFSDPTNRNGALLKLCRRLRASPKALDSLATGSATKSLVALFELMQTPQVLDAAGDFRDGFRETSKQIRSLDRHKRLHDFFQVAERAYMSLLDKKQQLQKEETTWIAIGNYVEDLDSCLVPLIKHARTAGFRPGKVQGWTQKLERALGKLREANESEDLEMLGRALQKMHEVFGRIPSRLNYSMIEAAGYLRLDELAGKLELIRDRLANFKFDEAAEARLQEVRRGIEPLKQLNERKSNLVDTHDRLQSMDDELRSHGEFPIHVPLANEIRDFWVDLCDLTRALSYEGDVKTIKKLQSIADELDAQVTHGTPEHNGQAEKSICRLFGKYWGTFKKGFEEVNVDLKEFCGQLRDVGNTLEIGIAGLQR